MKKPSHYNIVQEIHNHLLTKLELSFVSKIKASLDPEVTTGERPETFRQALAATRINDVVRRKLNTFHFFN